MSTSPETFSPHVSEMAYVELYSGHYRAENATYLWQTYADEWIHEIRLLKHPPHVREARAAAERDRVWCKYEFQGDEFWCLTEQFDDDPIFGSVSMWITRESIN